ncbi:MAG: hypothetical protein MJY76_03660 [Bacteroidales bacterium]|nr:hypothetical protein [Bacteroidales bacterium]
MKKFHSTICIAATLLFFVVNAWGQGRPVWVLGHGANWKFSTEAALNLGANGVEVDVRTRPAKGSAFRERDNTKGAHWSLGHDFFSPESKCDKKNPKHVSLRWLLTGKVIGYNSLFSANAKTLNDDERFCVLWLDCKDEEYLEELVDYVHACIPQGQDKFNFAIIYNIYDFEYDSGDKTKLSSEFIHKIERAAAKLKSNEFLNWGWRTPDEMRKLLNATNDSFTPSKHFYTTGRFHTNLYKENSSKPTYVREATALSRQGQFCARAGIWSPNTMWQVERWLISQKPAYPTDFDVVLTYFKEGYVPPLCKKNSLKGSMKKLFYSDGRGKNGKMHIAKRNEPFGFK